jgi:hypothetical protein
LISHGVRAQVRRQSFVGWRHKPDFVARYDEKIALLQFSSDVASVCAFL